MEERISQFLNNQGISRQKLLLAVSGGVDSMALLDLFSMVYPLELLTVAHANHGIRKESEAEEKLVLSQCEKYQIKAIVGKLKLGKVSEEEARRKRYAFLREAAAAVGADFIVTAHHADDQSETVLLNLVRGSGPAELWGMKEREGDILRPLINTKKEELLGYAKDKGIVFAEDASNLDPTYSRNYLRLEVIPRLKKLNPSLTDTVARTVSLGQESADVLMALTQEALSEATTSNALDHKKIQEYPLFIQKSVIREMLFQMTGKRDGIYSVNVEAVLALFNKSGTKKTEIGGFTVTRDYDKITFGSKSQKVTQKAKIMVGERVRFNDFWLKADIKETSPNKNNILLPDQFAYNLLIRTFREGDRIKTLTGTKKLQDLFTDAKIPLEERRSWPVVESDGEILWVPLVSANSLAKREKTKALVIEVRKI